MIYVVIWVVLSHAAQFLEVAATSRNTFAATPLGHHVSDVDGLCTQEKVNRVDARRVVAAVKDLKTIGDGTDREFIGNAAGQQHSAAAATRTDNTVPVLVSASNPKNAAAFRSGADVLAEAGFQRNGACFVVAGL